MQTTTRPARPDELQRLSRRPAEERGCFAPVFAVAFGLFTTATTWLMGSLTVDAAFEGRVLNAVVGIVFTLIAAGMTLGMGMVVLDALRLRPPATPPEVTTWTLRPTVVGFAIDADDRDILWCFATTTSGTYAIASVNLPWEEEAELIRQVSRATLQGEVLDGLLLTATAVGSPVPCVGPTDPWRSQPYTWSDGGRHIDVESPLWTRLERAPSWLRAPTA